MPTRPRSPIYWRRLQLSIMLMFVAIVVTVLSYPIVASISHQNGASSERVSWVFMDWVEYDRLNASTGSYTGDLHVPTWGNLYISNNTGATIELYLDDTLIYEGDTSILLDASAWRGQQIPLRLSYTLTDEFPPNGKIALLHDSIFRLRIAPFRYATNDLNPLVMSLIPIGQILSPLLFGIVLIVGFSALQLSRRDWLILVICFGVAFSIRQLSLLEKLASDGGIYQMESVWDNFVLMGRDWIRGEFPLRGTDYPAGNIIYMAYLQQMFTPDVSHLMQIHVTLGSLVPVLLMLVGWALFNRPAGYVIGFIAVIYAPLIHFQQTLLLDSTGILLMIGILVGLTGYIRWQSWLLLMIAGLSIGVLAVFRGSFALVGFWAVAVILLMHLSWRQKLVATTFVTIFALIPFSMPIIANFTVGNYWLTPSRSDIQLFRANNRDATGFNTHRTQSELIAMASGISWNDTLLAEIERYPTRPLQLTLRRLALYFEATEHSVDSQGKYQGGYDESRLLQTISLWQNINFRLLSILGFGALILGSFSPYRRKVWMIASGTGAVMLSLSFLYVEGRTRIVGSIPMIVLAGIFIPLLWELRNHPHIRRIIAITTISTLGFFILVEATIAYFPRPKTIAPSDIPSDIVPMPATFSDEIQLLGYTHYDSNYVDDGYLTFELYWQVLTSPQTDYVVVFRWIDTETGEIVDFYNTQLEIHAPTISVRDWQVGRVYIDRYLLTLPDDARQHTYELFMGLYHPENETTISLTDTTTEIRDDHMRLMSLRLNNPAPQSDNTMLLVQWENAIAVVDATCTYTDVAHIELAFVIQEQIAQNWHLFLHLYDADNNLITQWDGTIPEGSSVDALPAGQTILTTWDIPTDRRTSQVDIGFYNIFTGERRAITALNAGLDTDNSLWRMDCES